MVKRGLRSGTRSGVGFDIELDSDFAGSYPSSMTEVGDWTGASGWNIGWNFKDLTKATPNTCPPVSGSASRTLTVLVGGSPTAQNAYKLPAPQDGFADQGGMAMELVQKMLFATAPEWALHATVPSVYLFRMRFHGAPMSGGKPLAGVDGAGGGWSIQVHPTSGVRVLIGATGVGYVATSYIGGTSLYDGRWHTIALSIDDAGGKVKLICEFATTESTGLTISSTGAFATFGGTYKEDPMNQLQAFLFAYRMQHADAYTNSEDIFDAFEATRIAGGA